jgi:hypothetical protein
MVTARHETLRKEHESLRKEHELLRKEAATRSEEQSKCIKELEAGSSELRSDLTLLRQLNPNGIGIIFVRFIV